MTFVSYAQNFEDVMLWRALKHVANGFYVDVGAQDPVVDSVSLAFYEHGWRGVHIEPTAHYAALLRAKRPEEFVIQAAIGAVPGSIRFYEIPDTGLSTGDKEIADRHREQGYSVREITVSCLTLTQALAPYLDREIHWLKIDVEGYELPVVEGWQADKVKPWILVVESTAPLSQERSHAGWEPLVLKKGYQFAYFDGVNRFYVSPDHPELLDSFDRPPNFFDDFQIKGCASSALQQQLAVRNVELAETHQRVKAQDAELARTGHQLSETQARLSETQAQLSETQAQLSETQAQLAAMYASTSWKLTAPVRGVGIAARDLRAAPPHIKLTTKILLKPQLIRAGAYLASRPVLKSRLLRVLQPFPRLHARIARAARSHNQTQDGHNTAYSNARGPEDLTESGRRVYLDLLKARATAQAQRSGET